MEPKIRKVNMRISNLLYRIILIFAVVILTFLTASSFLIHGHLESNGTEYMYLIRNGVDFYILLVALTDGFYMRYFPYQLGMLTYEMGLL